MEIGNFIVLVFLTYYTLYIIRVLNKKNRKEIQSKNNKLEKLRTIPRKTLEEQKKFINIKYPKHKKFKFSFKKVPNIILMLIIYVVVFYCYKYLLNLTRLNIEIWQAVLFIIIFSIIINYFLSKINLQKSDLFVFFRR